MGQGPRINFKRPPAPGKTIPYRGGMRLTLIRAVSHLCLSGEQAWLLEWQNNYNDRIAVSPLRSRGVIWCTADDHLASIEKARAKQGTA